MYPESFDPWDRPARRPSTRRQPARLWPEPLAAADLAPAPSSHGHTIDASLDFETLPFAAVVFDPTGRILACNQAAARESGEEPGTMVGAHIAETFVHEAQFEEVAAALRRYGRYRGAVLLRSGHRVRVHVAQVEDEPWPRYLAIVDPVAATLFAEASCVVDEEVAHNANTIVAVAALHAGQPDARSAASSLAMDTAGALADRSAILERIATDPALLLPGVTDLGAVLPRLASAIAGDAVAPRFVVDAAARSLRVRVRRGDVVRMVRLLLAVAKAAAVDGSRPVVRAMREHVDGQDLAMLAMGFRADRALFAHAVAPASRDTSAAAPTRLALAALDELVTAAGGECAITCASDGVTRIALRLPLVPGER